jgi:hypothetical protein
MTLDRYGHLFSSVGEDLTRRVDDLGRSAAHAARRHSGTENTPAIMC